MLVINIEKMNGDKIVYQGSVKELYDIINAELGADTNKFIKFVKNVRGAVLWKNIFGIYYNI